jgi:hypothetical protein
LKITLQQAGGNALAIAVQTLKKRRMNDRLQKLHTGFGQGKFFPDKILKYA